MNKAKKIILLALAAVAGGTATAQTGLVIQTAGGASPKVIPIENIGKMTFGDDGFTVSYVTEGTAAEAFAYADVQSIKFSGEATAISGPTAGGDDGDALRLYCRGTMLHAEGLAEGTTARAAVYDVSGRTVEERGAWNGEPINVGRLPKGVYIFKVNNKTIKFTR